MTVKSSENTKSYKSQIIKWGLLGLLIRVAIMPFTIHGQDLVFVNYFPMMFVEKGFWDPYGFINSHFSYFPATYYGPVLFIASTCANFVFIKLFHVTSLVKILEIAGTMMGRGFTTLDYAVAFSGLNLYRNLFLMKSMYLVFDFLMAAMLLGLSASKDSALKTYKIWMLNIVVLHSIYAIGGAHIIPAFFIIAALYAAVKARPYLCVILLNLGGATQLFPYIFVLPACLLLGETWKDRVLLLLTGGIVSISVYLPFYLSSGSSVLGIFRDSNIVHYPGAAKWALISIFAASYFLICNSAIKDSALGGAGSKLVYYFLVIGLLNYASVPVKLRYLTFITPLLALIMPWHKKFAVFTLFIVLLVMFLSLTGRDLQLGLFAPLNPTYFLSFPTIQEVINRVINIEFVYKIFARLLPFAFFAAAIWVWRIKSNEHDIR